MDGEEMFLRQKLFMSAEKHVIMYAHKQIKYNSRINESVTFGVGAIYIIPFTCAGAETPLHGTEMPTVMYHCANEANFTEPDVMSVRGDRHLQMSDCRL